MGAKIKLKDYNNVSKTVSYSLYKIFKVKTNKEKEEYKKTLLRSYDADCLTRFLVEIAHFIGGSVLNISKQNYEPEGASANLLISEGEINEEIIDSSCNKGEIELNKMLHLDKSHITIHTYPEYDNYNGITILRSDIEISTCGNITPLSTINKIIERFGADVITVDYKIRGFYRNSFGNKIFEKDELVRVSKYISNSLKNEYEMKERVYSDINFSNCCLIKKDKDSVVDEIESEKIEIFNSL